MTRTANPAALRRGDTEAQRHKTRTLRLCVSVSEPVVLLLLLGTFAFCQQPSQSPDPFASRRGEAQSATGGHRAKLFVELAHEEMEAADKAFTDGNVQLGQKLATDAGNDADEASQTALTTGKRLKDTEIDLRRLQTRTRDIGRSLSFEDRPPITKIVERIEAMREAILNRMFGGKKGKS